MKTQLPKCENVDCDKWAVCELTNLIDRNAKLILCEDHAVEIVTIIRDGMRFLQEQIGSVQ